MSLTNLDRIIARQVGRLCWRLLPEMHPGIELNEREFPPFWDSPEPAELAELIKEDPPVNYPVIFLQVEVAAGLAPAPFLHPPNYGKPLRLSEYLSVLQRFLILQYTTRSNAHAPLIWRAVRSLATEVSNEELLHFVDQLWRSRWIVGADNWLHMRRSVITGGTDDGIRRLEEDVERLEAEALRLIQAVQQLKDSAESMDEWLHESYSLLPDILTWGLIIAWANKRHLSDELDKYHRVLDEFQADIGTTFTIPCCAPRGNDNLADAYAISPLLESETIDEAISKIRGIYRGRSIIPRVWYERAKTSLERLKETRWQRPEQIILQRADDGAPLSPTDYAALNEVDLSQAFGRAMTANSKENNWPFLGMLFDYWDSDADAKNQ